MNRLFFVAHGMGVHGQDWSTSIESQLKTLSSKYSAFQGVKPFEKRTTFVPITYDHVFKKYLDDFSSSADKLKQFISLNGIDIPFNLDFLESASQTEKNFFWSHIVDVLLYRFVPEVTAQVRVSVSDQIVRAVRNASANGADPEVHILAHSLGTSVMHDTLAHMAAFPIRDPDDHSKTTSIFTAGRGEMFETFITLANVSRVLERDPIPYKSMVNPITATHDPPQKHYVERYYNFRHDLDPIPSVKAFHPINFGSKYEIERINSIHGWNTHGFDHYLDNPAVHVPILRRVCRCTITNAEVPAYARFKIPGQVQATLQTYANELQQKVNLALTQSDVRTLMIAGMQLLARAKELAS